MVDNFDSTANKRSSRGQSHPTKSQSSEQRAERNAEHSQKHETRAKKFIRITQKWISFAAAPWIRNVALPAVRPTVVSSAFWTALASVAIAVLTGFYTHYARKQWEVMDRQLTLMRQQLEGTQAAVLKASRSMDINGFTFGLTNVRDVDATDVHIKIVMTPISLPNTEMGKPVISEVTLQRVEKDNPFGQVWPVPWPIHREMQDGWPGKTSVKVSGEYGYQDGLGTRISANFCDIWLPILNLRTKRENAWVGGPVPCNGIESTISTILDRKQEADVQQKTSPPN